jgi:hypothetical protein
MQVLVGEKVEFDNIAFCGEEVDDGDAVALSVEVGHSGEGVALAADERSRVMFWRGGKLG